MKRSRWYIGVRLGESISTFKGRTAPEKTVSGWRAVELAMDMRATNVPTPREAHAVSIGGFDFPFVSLLDDEHCHAEMDTVTISQRDFLPATPHSENEDGDVRPDLIESWGDCRRLGRMVVQGREDRGGARPGHMWSIGKDSAPCAQPRTPPLYANGSARWCAVSLSEKDQRPMRAITSFSARSTAIAAQTKSMAPQGGFRRPDLLPWFEPFVSP